ncbi:zinc ribbon domain-containing protein [Candidatus Pacearchaeota archaeon]|nr:zinc ribbon domain-containing protein [Candidatus Pacearchaeota archaeon]
MFEKKCTACAKSIKRDFNYCPYCGVSFKVGAEKENFGMLGRRDSSGGIQPEFKLPLGMGNIVNSLVKQLEREMNGNISSDGSKGFKIKIAMGQPPMRQVMQEERKNIEEVPEISEKEVERRAKLPTVEVESRVRRLADRIIYEFEAPGVQTKKDIVVAKLASGLEIKGYSKDKCYIKFIPLTVEIIEYYVENGKIFVELKA